MNPEISISGFIVSILKLADLEKYQQLSQGILNEIKSLNTDFGCNNIRRCDYNHHCQSVESNAKSLSIPA
ncbi:hypothetical Protein YC6258_05506 [Gynuella sunshinyii YC6258]|uniref:Uncharacterized protein n=1 Tax=Gynuella sunshinyii YC6258 TaxID=1445510 RepID=A0A0C5W4J4_9GAMM|nr:hypothetical Protein YC6258_05506 [Gynuella sunshinyii YC6258]